MKVDICDLELARWSHAREAQPSRKALGGVDVCVGGLLSERFYYESPIP